MPRGRQPWRARCLVATAIDDVRLSMSMAPRPQISPSTSSPPNGSRLQPAGDTGNARVPRRRRRRKRVGHHGAEWLVNNAPTPCAPTTSSPRSAAGRCEVLPRARVVITVGEKGSAWRQPTCEGHRATRRMPFRADNALVRAAEVVRLLAGPYRPAAEINDVWRAYAGPRSICRRRPRCPRRPAGEGVGHLRVVTRTRPSPSFAHTCTHTTISPDVVHGGA